MSVLAITGATGYLGSVVSSELAERGHKVIALTRRRPQGDISEWRQFDLGKPLNTNLFDDVNVLIHAAWVLSGNDTNELWHHNVVGSRLLLEAAVAAGVEKIVFVSSMSAYFGTRQAYGLMKLAVERTALDLGGIVVRPGLVYGPSPGGMAGTLKRISKLPLWPKFRSAKLLLAHEADVAAAMARALETYDGLSGHVLGFANPAPLDLSSILTGLSDHGHRRPGAPVPARLVMAVLRVLESSRVQLPFRSDSLLGLVESAKSLPGQELLAECGFEFRPLVVP